MLFDALEAAADYLETAERFDRDAAAGSGAALLGRLSPEDRPEIEALIAAAVAA